MKSILSMVLLFSCLVAKAQEEDPFFAIADDVKGTFTLLNLQINADRKSVVPKKGTVKNRFLGVLPLDKTKREFTDFIPSRIIDERLEEYPAAIKVNPRPSGLSQFFLIKNGSPVELSIMKKPTGTDIFVIIEGKLYQVFACAGEGLIFVNNRAVDKNFDGKEKCIEYRQPELVPKTCP